MIETAPIWLTLKLAFLTTIILLFVSIPLAWWLSRSKSIFKTIAQVMVSLPLVLPPTVIGFYLLLAFSPANSFGKFLEHYFDIRLAFSFGGLLIGSVIYSLPFMVHPVLSGLSSLPASLEEASYSLGKTKRQTLFKVLLPNIKPSLLTGIVLAFAHTIGEFGVVLMIGGNIPGVTRTISVSIYDQVQALNPIEAGKSALFLLAFAFVTLSLTSWLRAKVIQT